MDDISALLEFDSRYGFDENNNHQHQHQLQQHQHQLQQQQYHHQNTMATAAAPRYASNLIAGGPMPPPDFTAAPVGSDTDDEHAETEMYPSPTSGNSSQRGSPPVDENGDGANADGVAEEGAEGAKPAPKRKRENRYKNAPPSVIIRRRAQNRASQRAYRYRKEQRILDLEAMVSEMKRKHDSLGQAYSLLHAEYNRLRGGAMPQQQPQQQQQQATTPMLGGSLQGMFDVNGGMTYAAPPDAGMFLYPEMTTDYSS